MTEVITLPTKPKPRRSSPAIAHQTIYDVRQDVGDVVERQSGQFEAAMPNGRRLGLFNGAEAAVHALLLARAGKPE